MNADNVIEAQAVEVAEATSAAIEQHNAPIGDLNVWTNTALFDQTLRAANMLSKTSIVPQAYQGKPQDCFVALEMASRCGLSPLTVMQNLYVVQGKPSWSGQACMSLINACGKYKDVHHVYFGEKGTDKRGCKLVATKISDGSLVEGVEVTLEMAKSEGWTSKNGSKWRTMPELMLAYRASAFFARVNCPEALMGVLVEGEAEDISKDNAASASAGLTASIKSAIGK